MPTDAELVDTLRTGGCDRRRAWSLLVARHSRQLYAVARSFAVDTGTAEDLVQTAWLRLLERVEQLRDPDALGPWLCTVVRNEARRLVTRRREIPSVLVLDQRPDPADPCEERLIRDERVRAIRLAFAKLNEPCRQLLTLFLADPPLSYDELAAATGRPRGSLGPTRQRCLRHLRELMPDGFVDFEDSEAGGRR
jgi:RNA polymerase sigma factor (sigma-70 family)